MLPCTVTEPDGICEFWNGWLDPLGLENVSGEGHTAHFNGGSGWATYWVQAMQELTPSLLKSGYIPESCWRNSTAAIGIRTIGPVS